MIFIKKNEREKKRKLKGSSIWEKRNSIIFGWLTFKSITLEYIQHLIKKLYTKLLTVNVKHQNDIKILKYQK